MCGSTEYSKLRISGRPKEVERTASGVELEDDAEPVEPPPAEIPPPFADERALDRLLPATAEAPPSFDLAAASAPVMAPSAESFDRGAEEPPGGLIARGLAWGDRGSTPARGAPTGRPINDSTRQRTTSSTELSRKPISVTTRATSPWSTSIVVKGRCELASKEPCRQAAYTTQETTANPAAPTASHIERLLHRGGAGMTSAFAPCAFGISDDLSAAVDRGNCGDHRWRGPRVLGAVGTPGREARNCW
jgi:hypothetical protein